MMMMMMMIAAILNKNVYKGTNYNVYKGVAMEPARACLGVHLSLSLYIYIYTHNMTFNIIYIYIYTYTYVYVCIYIYIYIHTRIHTNNYIANTKCITQQIKHTYSKGGQVMEPARSCLGHII